MRSWENERKEKQRLARERERREKEEAARRQQEEEDERDDFVVPDIESGMVRSITQLLPVLLSLSCHNLPTGQSDDFSSERALLSSLKVYRS